jgi:hypothetical protein
MAYGTLTIPDLLASTTQSIAAAGPGYETAIWRAFEDAARDHNMVMDDVMSLFVEKTTERILGYGGVTNMVMDDIDELGTPHAQKVAPGENMGFPLRLTGLAHQWTRSYFEEATPADIAGQMLAAMAADYRRVTRDIKRAIFLPTNTSFVDIRTKDRPTLSVKVLCNADSMSVPIGPNGETFNAATHTHYAGTASFVVGDITTLISNVAEHYRDNEIWVYINQAQEAAVRAFTGFQAFVDARIVQSQTTSYARGQYELFDFNNRDIGILGGATVAVRPWVPATIILAVNRRAPKILKFREKRSGSGNFRLSFEDEDHPLRSKGYQREFGIGAYNRWGAAALDTANASYTAPTIT